MIEQLLNNPLATKQIDILSAYLFSNAKKNEKHVDHLTDDALSQIIHSKGNISLRTLHQALHISERHLERKFRQYVGISPKLFSKVYRFQEALKQLKHNHYHKLSDIAYENNFRISLISSGSSKNLPDHPPFNFKNRRAFSGKTCLNG